MDPTPTSSIRRHCLDVDNDTLFPSLIYSTSFTLSPDGGSNDGWCGVKRMVQLVPNIALFNSSLAVTAELKPTITPSSHPKKLPKYQYNDIEKEF